MFGVEGGMMAKVIVKLHDYYFEFSSVVDAPTTFGMSRNDITAYELALCVPVLLNNPFVEKLINNLPEEARRHFEESR